LNVHIGQCADRKGGAHMRIEEKPMIEEKPILEKP